MNNFSDFEKKKTRDNQEKASQDFENAPEDFYEQLKLRSSFSEWIRILDDEQLFESIDFKIEEEENEKGITLTEEERDVRENELVFEQARILLRPLTTSLHDGKNSSEQKTAFLKLIFIFQKRIALNMKVAGEVARKELVGFIEESKENPGAYYFQKYYQAFENKNPKTFESQKLSNGQIIVFLPETNSFQLVTEKEYGDFENGEPLPPSKSIKEQFSFLGDDISVEDVEDYVFFATTDVMREVGDDFGFSFETLDPKTQFYFLQYIKGEKQITIDILKEISKKSPQHFLKTFLSIEQGGKEMGNKILKIGTTLEKENANLIFEAYSTILNQADVLRQKIEHLFPGQSEISKQVFEALLVKAKDVLLSAEYITSKENKTQYQIEDLKNALEGIGLQLAILNDLHNKEKFEYQKISENNETKRLLVRDPKTHFEYDLKLLARPFENNKAQARVSMEVGFDTQNPNKKLQEAFKQKTLYKESGQENTQSSLRFSLDRDATNKENPFISLDIGNSSFEGQKLSRTGDVFGNSIALVSEYGSHTPVFDKKFANEEIFAGVVGNIQQEIKKI